MDLKFWILDRNFTKGLVLFYPGGNREGHIKFPLKRSSVYSFQKHFDQIVSYNITRVFPEPYKMHGSGDLSINHYCYLETFFSSIWICKIFKLLAFINYPPLYHLMHTRCKYVRGQSRSVDFWQTMQWNPLHYNTIKQTNTITQVQTMKS